MVTLKIIKFMVRDRCFALPSNNVKEVIDGYDNVKDISYGGHALKGVISFGGNLISVLDSASIFDIKSNGEEPMILVCKGKGMDWAAAITVSSIKGMEIVESSVIKPSHGDEATYISGYIREKTGGGETVVALIDLRKLLDYALTKVEK